MNFSNQPIYPAELPSIDKISYHPLEKEYLVVERISLILKLAGILAFASLFFFFIDKLREPVIIIFVMTIFTIFAIIAWLATSINYHYSGYALREKDLLYRSGWFIRKNKVVLLNRVQHISIQSGPIERRFGLSSISIFTAGASQADFTISGINEETAQRIKEWVNNQLNGDINQ